MNRTKTPSTPEEQALIEIETEALFQELLELSQRGAEARSRQEEARLELQYVADRIHEIAETFKAGAPVGSITGLDEESKAALALLASRPRHIFSLGEIFKELFPDVPKAPSERPPAYTHLVATMARLVQLRRIEKKGRGRYRWALGAT